VFPIARLICDNLFNFLNPLRPAVSSLEKHEQDTAGRGFSSRYAPMTMQQFDAASEVQLLKQQMAIARQRRVLQSTLTKHRGEIVALLNAGASYRQVEQWLKRHKHISIRHTTIMRFVRKLPEFNKKKKTDKINNQPEMNNAQLS
jgi:hypothetical protein